MQLPATDIDVEDDQTLADGMDIWRLTDEDRFPGVPGWDGLDFRGLLSHGGAVEHQLLGVRDGDGTGSGTGTGTGSGTGSVVGVALMEIPQRENRHSVGIDVRVHPAHRRRGVGTALVDEVARRARADRRTVINCLFEVPTEQLGTHPSEPFARRLGFEPLQQGNRRHLSLPVEPTLLEHLREDVAAARGAADYRILTFRGPWPAEFAADQCEMERQMSTDQPQADHQAEEEEWDEARLAQSYERAAMQGITLLSAVAQHVESGHLVAFTDLAVAARRPYEAWQWSTLVLREHRGHRLGLAVKLANLDFLASAHPGARLVITGNAAVNAPMIAVNDLMGFEVVATGTFWQKALTSA